MCELQTKNGEDNLCGASFGDALRNMECLFFVDISFGEYLIGISTCALPAPTRMSMMGVTIAVKPM